VTGIRNWKKNEKEKKQQGNHAKTINDEVAKEHPIAMTSTYDVYTVTYYGTPPPPGGSGS
jgi:hypothetical protein